jgi:hypothetical protein
MSATLSLRARVLLRRGMLDSLLAAGADPSWDPELGLRAEQISTPRTRRTLAASLERAVSDAQRPPRWTCSAPLARRAIRKAAPELRALAARLIAERAPSPQGVALASQLLRDPGSPLYAPGGEEALRFGARLARRSLGRATRVA